MEINYLHINFIYGVTEISREKFLGCFSEGVDSVTLNVKDCVRDLRNFDREEAVAKVTKEVFDIIEKEFGINLI